MACALGDTGSQGRGPGPGGLGLAVDRGPGPGGGPGPGSGSGPGGGGAGPGDGAMPGRDLGPAVYLRPVPQTRLTGGSIWVFSFNK